MSKEMLINVTEGEECRIAITEDGRLEELYMERTSSGSHVGNIYKGRITNVEPSIQAAFVDFGLEKNGFLHISDVQPTYFRNGNGHKEDVGRKTGRRDRPPIQDCLRRGQEVIVQITKEGIGTKGPTLTTYISIPGRYLVLMPGMGKMGVSRKIEDDEIRRKLRQQLEQLRPPENMGFIIRTAGLDRTKEDLQRDLNYLVRLWRAVERNMKGVRAPVELYQESDLVIRTIRDIYTNEIERIICDNETVARKAADFLSIALPRSAGRVELYESPIPLFHKYGIEKEIESIHSRTVKLTGGGSLVVDQTEALVAIDVNSGKFRDPDNAEQTAFQINQIAAKEIARQLRLRDLGGVIVCDFIDMMEDRHQRGVERVLADAMSRDRARSKVLGMSRFGIIEMTRQRLRPSLRKSVYHNCPGCGGGGMVKTPESVCLDVMRLLQLAVHKETIKTIEVFTSIEVAEFLNNKRRRALAEMEERTGKRIVVKIDTHLGAEQLQLKCFDARSIEVRFDAAEFVGSAKASLTPMSSRRDEADEHEEHEGHEGRDHEGHEQPEAEFADADERPSRRRPIAAEDEEREPVAEEPGEPAAADEFGSGLSDRGGRTTDERRGGRGGRGDRDRHGGERRGDEGRRERPRGDRAERDSGDHVETGDRAGRGDRNDRGNRSGRGRGDGGHRREDETASGASRSSRFDRDDRGPARSEPRSGAVEEAGADDVPFGFLPGGEGGRDAEEPRRPALRRPAPDEHDDEPGFDEPSGAEPAVGGGYADERADDSGEPAGGPAGGDNGNGGDEPRGRRRRRRRRGRGRGRNGESGESGDGRPGDEVDRRPADDSVAESWEPAAAEPPADEVRGDAAAAAAEHGDRLGEDRNRADRGGRDRRGGRGGRDDRGRGGRDRGHDRGSDRRGAERQAVEEGPEGGFSAEADLRPTRTAPALERRPSAVTEVTFDESEPVAPRQPAPAPVAAKPATPKIEFVEEVPEEEFGAGL